jgi:hypothetical protein
MNVAARSLARTWVLLCAVGGVLSCASSSSDPDLAVVHAAISGGQPDSVDSNVFVLVSHRGTAGVALCSASLIAPNLLLTARHCVASVTTDIVTCGQTVASAPFAASSFFATNTQSLDQATSAFGASAVSVPSQATDICGFDLALITLDSLVPPSVAQPLVPRIDRAVSRGESYSAVGYGQDSPGDAGIAGQRMDRAGLKVDCAPGGCGDGVEASEFVGDTGICSGDSGGPALDADGKVVGVVSRSTENCARPVYGSVASWKDWLIGVAKQAAVQGQYTPPLWVQTGSSDPQVSAADSGAGSAGESAGSFGTQGDKCGAPQDCTSGFGCFSPTGSASNAYCAQFCDAQTSCANGTHCQSGVGACLADAAPSADSSSCALRGRGPSPGPTGSALLGAAAVALAGWRRRRARRAGDPVRLGG